MPGPRWPLWINTFTLSYPHHLQNLISFHLQGPLSERLPWPAYFKLQATPQAVISKPLPLFLLYSPQNLSQANRPERCICHAYLSKFIIYEDPDFCLLCLQDIELRLIIGTQQEELGRHSIGTVDSQGLHAALWASAPPGVTISSELTLWASKKRDPSSGTPSSNSFELKSNHWAFPTEGPSPWAFSPKLFC